MGKNVPNYGLVIGDESEGSSPQEFTKLSNGKNAVLSR